MRSLLAFLAPVWPGYQKLVRDEADRLIESLGTSAHRYACTEAEESLSPFWASFMRRVAKRISYRPNQGA